jgi:hypothetical protein
MMKSRVSFWVQEVGRGRGVLRGAKRPGRPPNVDFDTILAHKLEMNPQTMTRKLALSLGVSLHTVTIVLGVRSVHLMLKALDDSY